MCIGENILDAPRPSDFIFVTDIDGGGFGGIALSGGWVNEWGAMCAACASLIVLPRSFEQRIESPLHEWRFSNLLELLRFYAERYCELVMHSYGAALQQTIPNDGGLADKLISTLLPKLPAMKRDCEEMGLEATADHIAVTLERWHQYEDKQLLSSQLTQLYNVLQNELKRKTCFILPRASREFYENPLAGWEQVAEVFPDTIDDIEEMNKCRALGRDSASVFHVLLVVEHGLIDLGKTLRVTDPKLGWDATCRKLDEIMKDGHAKCPAHLKRHFAFLELVNKDIQSMKMAWRNKVNHAAHRLVVVSSDFKPQVAEKIITACHGFMLLLATEGP